MGVSKISIPLAVFVWLIVSIINVEVSNAQDSPWHYLVVHNIARAQVGIGPVTWNDTLAAYATNHVNKLKQACNLAQSGGPYGENLASSWGKGDMSGVAAVTEWVSEKKFYDYKTNTCAGGKRCNRYLQVVQRNTLRIGCGKARCTNGGALIVCSYYPRGSLPNQRPYDVDPNQVPLSSDM